MRWLGVWLPQWELDYLRHMHGFSKEAPLVLYDVTKAKVIKACLQAARFGVRAEQSMGSAAQLCHQLQPFRDEPSLHQGGCEWLCLHGYSFSARIVPPPEPELMFERCHDVLLLETGSMAQLFGGEDALAKAFAKVLSALGCHFAMAFADTPLAAGVLARRAATIDSASPHSHPFINTTKQPDSHLPINTTKQASLARCPLAFLPLPTPLRQRLEGMGLEYIGELNALPASELGIRFGRDLVLLLSRLTGKSSHPQRFYCPPEQYHQRLELLYEAENLSALVFVLGRMFTELALFLRQRQLAVSTLELVLHYRELEHVDRQYDMQGHAVDEPAASNMPYSGILLAYPFAEHTAEGLLALCRLQLERVSLSAPVMALTLHRCHFTARSAPPSALENSHRASLRLLARLEARLGGDRIKRLGARPSLLPAQSVELHPMAVSKKADVGLALNDIDGLGFACRPPWLLPTPQLLDEETIVLLRGPERLREPWWQGVTKEGDSTDKVQGAARDYYLARHCDGGLCWVFRREGEQGLYLQGWF